MASYAMAHLQMDLLLTETGFKPTKEQRFKIYLTNSLEESHPDTGTLFANWLSSEANEANFIKRDSPVMCIIGNPPYSGESANKGEWIMKLMEDYKKEPGGKEKLKERNPKWINDDYVKFLRYGQHFIEKNGSGVLAFINPHGFLDNPTFRGMRWNLLKTYDKIYTIDLHGNAKKKETSPDGSADINVFDIEQGVSINVFVKTGKKKPTELGKVFHYDLYGKRDFKYDFLEQNSLKTIDYKELPSVAPNYFFVNKNFDEQKMYDEGFAVNILFTLNNVGIVTAKDSILINETKVELIKNVENYYNIDADINKIMTLSYRPFDNRLIYFDLKLIERAREKVMNHFINTKNIGLVVKRQCKQDFSYSFVTNQLTEGCLFESAYANNSILPLYLYPETNGQLTTDSNEERVPNLNQEIVHKIENELNLKFTNEKEKTASSFSPIDILDYIYAVLHSPNYREKYKEFLKIDFPKIPYPKNAKTFWDLVALGSQIRDFHLLESPKVEDYITEFNIDGDCVVEKPIFKNGNVYINETQNFENVPEVAWNFYIGGYQPAQKWLKDRKGRKLEFGDIAHYQKIIVALTETDRIMKEINEIEIENIFNDNI
jgi:predicted helicase